MASTYWIAYTMRSRWRKPEYVHYGLGFCLFCSKGKSTGRNASAAGCSILPLICPRCRAVLGVVSLPESLQQPDPGNLPK